MLLACLLSCYRVLGRYVLHTTARESSNSKQATWKEHTRTKDIKQRKRCRHTDGDVVLGGLELPESDIDGDTTLTLGLELVKDPCVLEGTLAEFGGFLRKLLAS